MKKFFYSIWVTLLLLIVMTYFTTKFWSLPMIIVWVIFYVFYFERRVIGEDLKNNKIKKYDSNL